MAASRVTHKAGQKPRSPDSAEGSKSNKYMAFLFTQWLDVVEKARIWARVSEILRVERYGYLPGLFPARVPVAL